MAPLEDVSNATAELLRANNDDQALKDLFDKPAVIDFRTMPQGTAR